MYFKKANLAVEKQRRWHRATGGYDYIAVFIKLRLECPVCHTEGDFSPESFDIMTDLRQVKNDQFLALGEEFCCQKCGVSSIVPDKEQKQALQVLTHKAIEDLKKKLPPRLRKILEVA